MKSLFTILLILPLICLAQYTYNHLQVNFLETPALTKNYTYQNLRLYPVYAKESFKAQLKTLGKYMSLHEAFQRKKLKISEKPGGGSVNNLTVENISADTIIIICGDIIKGGQQDRIVQKDIVLKPKSNKQNLDVFCVESGRWSARNEVISARPANNVSAQEGAKFENYYK